MQGVFAMENTPILSAANAETLTQKKSFMTTREIAEVLNVSVDTIQNAAKKLSSTSDNFRKFTKGQTARYSEEEVTAIKLELQNHSKVNELSPKTDLEIDLFIQKAMQLQDEKIKRLQATVNNLLHAPKLYTASEIAKEIGMKSAIALNKWLNDKKIQYFLNGTWIPYSEYADKNYFSIKQDVLENGTIIYDRKITNAGRLFIIELRNKDLSNIKENIKNPNYITTAINDAAEKITSELLGE